LNPIERGAARNIGPFRDEEAALRALVDRLVAALLPEAVYLVGSRAEGRARPDSDFDFVVVMSDSAGEGGRDYDRAYAPVLGLGVGCDVVPYLHADFEADRARQGTLAYTCHVAGRLVYRGGGRASSSVRHPSRPGAPE
jgi:hypothetical protein